MTKKKAIFIPEHAQARLRQRVGLQSLAAMQSWTSAKLLDGKLIRIQPDGRKVYRWGDFEIVVSSDETALITVKDLGQREDISERLQSAVVRETKKALLLAERAFRKAEINVAEITLNMLKCRNPKIKASLNEKLTKANDEKEKIKTEILLIKKAAQRYGVEV